MHTLADQPRHDPFIADGDDRYRALVESAPDAIVIADGNGRMVLVNAQTEALFGYPREEMLGQPLELLLPERFRAPHVGLRRDYTANPHTRPMGVGLDLAGRRKDGGEFPVSISLSPFRIGPELYVFSDIRDISEQRETQKRIQELNDTLAYHNAELKAINQELEAFSYSVSHDLRAPLRAIDGFSQILLKENAGQLDEKGLDRLNRVRKAAQHMGNLIDDLLKLARVTRSELQFQPVNLSELATEVLEALRKQEPERAVTVNIAPNLYTRGDPKLLRIALDNLLGNAWKFTGKRDDARIELGVDAGVGPRLLRARQRRRLRHGLRRQTVRRLPAPARRRRVSRHRHRAGHGSAHRPQARRPRVGRKRGGPGRHLPLHPGSPP
jgi:PAS domain S-box-containing protein